MHPQWQQHGGIVHLPLRCKNFPAFSRPDFWGIKLKLFAWYCCQLFQVCPKAKCISRCSTTSTCWTVSRRGPNLNTARRSITNSYRNVFQSIGKTPIIRNLDSLLETVMLIWYTKNHSEDFKVKSCPNPFQEPASCQNSVRSLHAATGATTSAASFAAAFAADPTRTPPSTQYPIKRHLSQIRMNRDESAMDVL